MTSAPLPAPLEPGAVLECRHLRPAVAPPAAETVQLRPAVAEKRIVLNKTGSVVAFSREDFKTVARCLKYEQASRWVEEEASDLKDSPLRDAGQLSYVAAALLDLGRASVRVNEEDHDRTTIVRAPWSAQGCRGHCTSTGRDYRLSESDPTFFLRVSDTTDNRWE